MIAFPLAAFEWTVIKYPRNDLHRNSLGDERTTSVDLYQIRCPIPGITFQSFVASVQLRQYGVVVTVRA